MASDKEVKFSLRVMINKEKTKVLFADAHSDFADALISFLTLPLGTIVRLLKKHYGNQAPVLGSLNTLYNGLANLDTDQFWTKEGKLMLLNPRSSLEAECRKLKLNVDDTKPTKYFTCENASCFGMGRDISIYYSTMRCSCGKSMNKEEFMSESTTASIFAGYAGDDTGAIFDMRYNFLISDDLRMTPYSTGTMVETLSNLGIVDTSGAEIRTVTVGYNWVRDLLRGMLLSRTPLTDLILKKGQLWSATAKCESETARKRQKMGRTTSLYNRKMIVKAMIQKSTNKLLFAEAHNDFVDFLSSLLTIPLGVVVPLLGGKISLGSVDDLYRSITGFNGCLKSEDMKTKLLKPVLPHMYLSSNQILRLTEQKPETMYNINSKLFKLNTTGDYNYFVWKDPKGSGCYVKGPRMFMITDDLTVEPLFVTSSFSTLKKLKVPLTDVEERTVQIRMEEGLRILEASLTSTTTLTDILSPMLKK